MSPVPILYAIARMNIGGAQRHLLEVLSHLDRQRFTPVLYCMGIRPADRFLDKVREIEVEILDGQVRGSLIGPGLILPVLRLSVELQRRRVGLLHSYLFHANFLGTLAARLARVPVALVSKRSLDIYTRSGERWACRFGNRLADRVTANAEAVKLHVHQEEQCPVEKIVVIPNGIDLNRVDREVATEWEPALPIPEARPLVGTVGRLSQKKGQRDLLEAIPFVLKQFPEARFLFVGDGPLREELEQRTQELRIGERIHFLGAVDDGARVLSQMDVFVLPSHIEGMSNALIEAMAASRPVVATDVGGNAEVVADGQTGFLVPPRNPDCLAKAIICLLKDPAHAQVMGKAGRARVEAHFTVQTMVSRIESLYQDLLAAKGVRCEWH